MVVKVAGKAEAVTVGATVPTETEVVPVLVLKEIAPVVSGV
jgi:hypothetical protein